MRRSLPSTIRSKASLKSAWSTWVWLRREAEAAVEAARAQQGRVEDLGPVGGAQHDHVLGAGEAVHLGQDLVQGLFALVVAADAEGPAAGPADGVQLVDEDDRR